MDVHVPQARNGEEAAAVDAFSVGDKFCGRSSADGGDVIVVNDHCL